MKKIILLLFLSCFFFMSITVVGSPCDDCDDDYYNVDFLIVSGRVESLFHDGDKTYVNFNEFDMDGLNRKYVFYDVSPEHIFNIEEAEDDGDEIDIFYQIVDGKCYIVYTEISDELDFFGIPILILGVFIVGVIFGLFLGVGW